MTMRGMWIGVALLLTVAAASCGAKARRPVHAASFSIRLLSNLTMAAFNRAMRGCTFFEGRNPLRDLMAGKRSSYAYGALCRGADALAPEVKVEVEWDERLIYVTPDFSDAIIDKFVAALKARDRSAIAASFSGWMSLDHMNADGTGGGVESAGAPAFFAYLEGLTVHYGNLTDVFCRKRRFVMPGSYTPMYNCWLYFARLPEQSRIWFQPDASEDGIDEITVEDSPPFGAPGSGDQVRAPGA